MYKDNNILPSQKDYIPLSAGFLNLVRKYNFKVHTGTAFGRVNGQYVSIGSFARFTYIVITLFNKEAEDLARSIIQDLNMKNVVVEFNQLEIAFPSKYYREKKLLQKIDDVLDFWTKKLKNIQSMEKLSNYDFVLMNNISFPKDEMAITQYKENLMDYLKVGPNNLRGMIRGILNSLPLVILVSLLVGAFFYYINMIFFPFNYFLSMYVFLDNFKKNINRLANNSWLFILAGLFILSVLSMMMSFQFAYFLKYKALNIEEFLFNFLKQFKDGYIIRTNLMFVAILLLVAKLQRRIPENVQIYEGWALNSEEQMIFESKINRAKIAGIFIVTAIGIGALFIILAK